MGTITVEGEVFLIEQEQLTCAYAISPETAALNPLGGTGSIGVTAPGECDWTARSNNSWITITSGGSGTGSGLVNYSVTANYTGSSRTGSIVIATRSFTVTQSPTCFLTQIHLTSPQDGAALSSAPTFTWMSDACPGDAFAVEIAIPPWLPLWSTYNNLGLRITEPYWTMPRNLWIQIPPGSTVYWRVRGRNEFQTPPAIITSDEVWTFRKRY